LKSGWVFTILAVICLAVGLIIQNGTLFLILGVFWLAVAIIMRSRFGRKTPPGNN
jgi:uncharacterized membrane protein